MYFINLHTHSTYSDGTLPPEEVLNLAIKNKITYFSLTDHDVISGWNILREKIKDSGVKYIYGIEITTRNHDYLHILGYNIDIENARFLAKLADYRNRRIERIKKIFRKLKDLGLKADFEELEFTGNASFGRPHLARFLKKKKFIKTVKEGFEKYIAYGRPAYEPPFGPDVKEAIETIKECGGLAVLAHPGVIDMEIDFKKLKDYGLDGIEAFYYSHSNSTINKYLKIAQSYSLNVTAGTDFHGPGTDRGKMYGFEYQDKYFNWLDSYFRVH